LNLIYKRRTLREELEKSLRQDEIGAINFLSILGLIVSFFFVDYSIPIMELIESYSFAWTAWSCLILFFVSISLLGYLVSKKQEPFEVRGDELKFKYQNKLISCAFKTLSNVKLIGRDSENIRGVSFTFDNICNFTIYHFVEGFEQILEFVQENELITSDDFKHSISQGNKLISKEKGRILHPSDKSEKSINDREYLISIMCRKINLNTVVHTKNNGINLNLITDS
jgi:hypothetical protein